MEISAKQEQFNAAMVLYSSQSRYRVFGLLVSTTNISLQIYLLYRIWPVSISLGWQVLSIVAAYLLTDFINGLVHMYMDNNDRYESLDGPLMPIFTCTTRPRSTKNTTCWWSILRKPDQRSGWLAICC